MYLPNYNDGSIVNLMSSIKIALGRKTLYKPLKGLDIQKLKKSRHIILMVVDGLGYELLMNNDIELKKYVTNKITSVFPSTTSAAFNSFITGLAPQQHAFTGWFVYLKEIGMTTQILLFATRAGHIKLDGQINPNNLYNMKPFFDNIQIKKYTVIPKEMITREYIKTTLGKTKIHPYNSLKEFFDENTKIIKSNNNKTYVYSYWTKFDTYQHNEGVNSRKVKEHLKEFDKRLKSFIKSIQNTNTTLIITADHGLANIKKSNCINLSKKHPNLYNMLSQPLSGDSRVTYCYVKNKEKNNFVKYVKTKLRKYCEIYKSEDLIKKGFFGLYEINPKLIDRIGDYTLISKDGYALFDELNGQKYPNFKANHSGLTKEEMFVPLIVINT
ncbi:Type I phosphodiesterase / nucleotide pyrophosphatase [Candidatus Tiddalikarchaeum anstoanum]|nr:Type I phosphodiesterase / nucleotide pyrophosphatase [Candidatus Tiddalikarchaeum anstoanum]